MDIKIESLNDVKKLLAGQHDSQQKVQVGYTEINKDDNVSRKIGDKWFDDDGNEWEQRNGYKIKLGKEWQQELHDYLNTFPNCQKESCTCMFPKKLDEKMRRIHGMCFDCVVKMEHKIRLEGKWDEYEKRKLKENALAWLAEAERDKDAVASELSRMEFTNDFGDNEKWTTPFNKEEMLEKIEKEFAEFRKNFIEKLERDLGERVEES